jgi:SpoIID/LytB domain protein
MPPIAAHSRRQRRAPQPFLVAVVAAVLIALLGGLAGAPRTAFGADPTPTPTPTATPGSTWLDEPFGSQGGGARSNATPTAPAGATVLGPTVTFFGRGYGHGVGMSQHGARGRALAGQDSTAILAHYYRGATLGTMSTTARIRVRVLYRWVTGPTSPLVVYGRVTAWTIDGIATTFPVDAALRLTPTTAGSATTWRVRVTAASGAVLHDGPKPANLVIRGTATNSLIQLWSKPTTWDQYRGVLRIIASTTSPTVNVVNDLPLETYLRGVVPVEMPSTWPAEALEAQSIASRSYAARRLRPGVSYYDVPDGSSSQVYRGALAERSTTNAVIKATAGVVLRSGRSIANTLFHSTGGGATEHNENVFTSSTGAKTAGVVSYLRGSPDRAADGRPYDAAAPFATWTTKAYTIAQLSAWLAADPRTSVGTLIALDLRDRGVSGRLISVTLIGSAGTRKVSGEVFRSVFNAGRPAADPMLRSTLFATAPIP